MLRHRRSLLWLAAPFLLYLGALPFVNRIHPLVLGIPFFLFWMLLATLLTPLAIGLAARGDPAWHRDRRERHRAPDGGESDGTGGTGESGGTPGAER